ncbi:MAG: YbaB/EbfC family nucleoid-associated protein [Clostridia bacterium]|nr:YbaB/EbfC family nucleoid-associated protein [Clostridia bacterium]
MKVRIPNNGGAGNMANMLKQAQKMQEDMAAMQAELEAREYEVSAGGGMATVKVNGKKELISLEVQPEIVDPDDIETLTDIIIAAVNQAMKQVDEVSQEEMSKITGQMNLPGMNGLF